MEEINTIIKRGGLDNLKRKLIVNPEYLIFENTNGRNSSPSRFEKNEIVEYRFGMKWIRGFEFIVGREYQIFIRNKQKKSLKINFKSFYGIRKNQLHQLYVDLIDRIWKFYFSEIVDNFLKQISNGAEIEICNTIISKHGLKFRNDFIEWEKVGTKDYHNYFAIFDSTNPSKINAAYYYLNDWNVGPLYSIVRTILDQMDKDTHS